jgi:hypothetical protein
MIPNKCKWCSYLDHDESDDGEETIYSPICTYPGGGCIEDDKPE